MKKLALALAAAACLSAPVQAVAQSKPAPAIESKSAKAEGWTSGKILAVAGGATDLQVGNLAHCDRKIRNAIRKREPRLGTIKDGFVATASVYSAMIDF